MSLDTDLVKPMEYRSHAYPKAEAMREHSHEQAGLAGVDDHQKHGGGGAVFAAVEHHGELEDGQPDVDGDEGRQYDGAGVTLRHPNVLGHGSEMGGMRTSDLKLRIFFSEKGGLWVGK